MARLNLVAIPEDAIASPGNANNLYIVVSVTDSNGTPVTGLTVGNFTLSTEIVGPGGSISHINSLSNANYLELIFFRYYR
jgi:hypothetical protein